MLDSYRYSWLSTVMAIAAAANLHTGAAPAERIYPLGKRVTSWTRPHQGKQEMARRRRQIASGMLRPENGLAVTQTI